MCEGNFNFNSAKRAMKKIKHGETEVAWRKCINYYQHYSYNIFSVFFSVWKPFNIKVHKKPTKLLKYFHFIIEVNFS